VVLRRSLELERRALQLFEEAIDLPSGERAAFLDRACGSEDDLRRWVLELLRADQEPTATEMHSVPKAEEVLASLERSAFEARIGQRIGSYRLQSLLGVGGMGAVYAACREEGFVQEVAIKLLRPGLVDGPSIARFERERQVLASLDHPLIALLLDGGLTDDGQPFLVMERIEGLPITDHADRQKLGIAVRLELVVAIASAVAHAHRRLIVHRDLKSSNILIDGEGRPKLLDFGIAKVLDGATIGVEPLTLVGTRPLTPGYASPEQIQGHRLGTATDQYSLAALTFELLVGRTPWHRQTSWHDLAQVVALPAPTLHAALAELDDEGLVRCAHVRGTEPAVLKRRLDGDLERILAKALAREADERYPSIELFAADLAAYLAGKPIAARPSTWTYRTRKFIRRNPVIAFLGGLCLALALFLIWREWGSSRQLAAERDQARLGQRRAEEEKRRSREVGHFLVDLFGQADPRLNAGRALTVEELLSQGVASLNQQPAGDLEPQALLLTTLARAQQNLGELDQAAATYGRALELRQEAWIRQGNDEHRAALAAALDGLGQAERLRGKFQEAEQLSRQALELRRLLPASDVEELAENLDNLAEALHELGRLDEAEAPYLEALALRRQSFGEKDLRVAESLDHFALLERNRGRYLRSLELYGQALVIREALLPLDHRDIAQTRHVMGMIQHDLGHLDSALSSLETALAAIRRTYQPPHPELALCLNDLGVLEAELGRFEAAEGHLREALLQRRRLYSGDHPELVQTLGSLGGLCARRGNLKEASILIEEALVRALRLFGEEHMYVAITRQYRADWLARSGRSAEAIAEMDRAIAILAQQVGEEHPRYWRARLQRAHLLCRFDSPAEGQRELERAALRLERILGADHEEAKAARRASCRQ